MLSNTIRVGDKPETLSGFDTVNGIDRSGQKYPSGLPLVGEQAGFSRFTIAGYKGHEPFLSVRGKKEKQDSDQQQLRQHAAFTRPLCSRRIYPVPGYLRLFLFHPYGMQVGYWLKRCPAHWSQPGGHCRGKARPCVIGELAIFVQTTGWISQWSPSAASRRQSRIATKRKENQRRKTVKKEHSWPVGNRMIIGGKAIFPDRDTVFFQLYFDYYANRVNHRGLQGSFSGYDQLHWPSYGQSCGQSCGEGAVTPYDKWKAGLVADTGENSGRCRPDGAGSARDIPGDYPWYFNSGYFSGRESQHGFAVCKKSLFGFWNIKLLTALLIFFLLISGLEVVTGIHGYVSLISLSAGELLSGLIIALVMIVMVLLVWCALLK